MEHETLQSLFDFLLFVTLWTGALVVGAFAFLLVKAFVKVWTDSRWHREQAKLDRRNRNH